MNGWPTWWAGLAAAKAAGLTPVKANTVLDPTTGRADVVELLRFCLEHAYQLRVIEQMPLDAGHQCRCESALTADEVLAALRPYFRLRSGSGAARFGASRAVTGRHGAGHAGRKVRGVRLGVARVLLGL